MNSLDTNILVYAANVDCDEHQRANQLVNQALSEPHGWIIAEQVLFEYYKALRHPRILSYTARCQCGRRSNPLPPGKIRLYRLLLSDVPMERGRSNSFQA